MIGSLQGDESISFQGDEPTSSRNVARDRAGRSRRGDRRGRHRRPARSIPASSISRSNPSSSATSPPTTSSIACAIQAGAGRRRQAVPDIRLGPARPRRAPEQCDLSIYAAVGRHRRALRMGAQADDGAAKIRRADRRQFRPAAGRAGGRRQHRPRDAQATGPVAQRGRQRRSTTPTASDRSRPSTTRSTSITS